MNTNADTLAPLFNSLEKITNSQHFSEKEINQISHLFSIFFEILTESQPIGFTTLFSRIAFISVKYSLPSNLVFHLHDYRKLTESENFDDCDFEVTTQKGIYLISETYKNVDLKFKGLNVNSFDLKFPDENELKSFERIIRCHVIGTIDKDGLFPIIDERQPHLQKHVKFPNKNFQKQLEIFTNNITLPFSCNLVDNEYNEGKLINSKAFVLKPDFLVGVTSISECFQSQGQLALSYLTKKLLPIDPSVHMLVGNIVNYFLDELVYNPDLSFEDIVKSIFQLAPEHFSMMDDGELIQVINKVKKHFTHLKQVVNSELADAGITKDKAYLEPSFYSNDYGLYGRLDLYHFNEKTGQSDIVELKSGKLYKANSYGLNENHYTQTLLYDLIIESIYKSRIKSNNYILYSVLPEKRLKFAPKIRSKQYDALHVRNDIIMIEYMLTQLDQPKYDYLLGTLDPDKIPSEFNFVQRDAAQFFSIFSSLTQSEKAYYKVFLSFLSNEYALSKTGEHGIHRANGLASLWLDPLQEKINQFSILNHLRITKDLSNEYDPIIELSYSENSNTISRFRVGDIVVMYPATEDQDVILRNQIFKSTILDINSSGISIKLRARQKNSELFNQFEFWNLEGDILDSSYNNQFRSLFEFLKADAPVKNKILGIESPKASDFDTYHDDSLTEEQNQILNAAIASNDYYLMWGPPGTGKTSVMINRLVKHYYENTSENIILLAYTNRAVDEICTSIKSVVGDDFIRVGSRYSTGKQHLENLLSAKIQNDTNRKALRELILNTRIFVATIASFHGKRELHALKNFEIAIIDEASQLLEPMVIGMLTRFNKFIMIGDHKQLPAVVRQSSEKTKINNPELNDLCLVDTGKSIFERLLNRSQDQGWDHVAGALTFQGRMHQDIVNFISPQFYDGKLNVLPQIERLISKPNLSSKNELQEKLIIQRLIFIDTPVAENLTLKINKFEAGLVNKLIGHWKEIYYGNQLLFDETSIGVISPFRAQISTIRKDLNDNDQKLVTVDTIERYQGGARDRIIISLAVNKADMLDSISNLSDDGIDRKLNVALTRAREHIIVLGSADVLKNKPIYYLLIDQFYHLDYKEIV